MRNKIRFLQNQIQNLDIANDLICVLLYGSAVSDSKNYNDLDGIIVVKKVTPELSSLFRLLEEHFAKLDFNIYTEYEVKNRISYLTREFKLEYLAKGICIFGKNIFATLYQSVTQKEYRLSIFIRSVEHLQMVRQKYFFGLKTEEEKFKYLYKYFFRISKNILLFYGKFTHITVNKLTNAEVLKELYDTYLFDRILDIEKVKKSDQLLSLFALIEEVIYKMKTEI